MPDRESLEIAQHEIASALHRFEVDRRDFLKLFGSGVIVCLCVKALPAQESGAHGGSHEAPQDIASWLHIAEDGRVTVYTGKVEMGQNIRTSLSQQVAEELRLPVNSITMLMGDTAQVPWDMGTFGSRTTPQMGPQLRTMAAAARDVLLAMAAKRWGNEPSALVVADGKITNPGNHQAISYGELTRGQKLVQVVSGDPELTPATQWKIAGHPMPKINGRDFVTGKHQYTSDLHPAGMMFGKVLRPEGFKARLLSLDASAAEKFPGVKLVRDGDFVGVVAPDAWTAERAVEAIHAKWSVPPQPSNKELFDVLKKRPDTNAANRHSTAQGYEHTAGSVVQARRTADVKLERTYTVQYIAHAPLEPRAAVAEWNGDHLTVWTGTQRPFAVRDELSEAFHLDPDKVRVIVPDTGAAYGGKHTGDAAIEAARLARGAGNPVKLVWTREEEFTWAYFRPAGVIEVRSGARRDGKLVAWEFHNYNSGPAAIGTPYDVPNQLIQFHPADSPLRQGSYRALAATANHFARESHMDEVARELGMDPLEFRLKNLADDRLKAVFTAAAERYGWARRKPAPERGFGIAGGLEKGGRVATVAEIEVDPSTRRLRLTRVVNAFECGAVVNPDGLRNQMEGCVVQAIGGALFEAVEFANGRILNPHFAQYRVPRFPDVPEIELVVVDRKDLPSAGAGEVPLVGLAPAIANAIASATGTRIRHMPLSPNGKV